MLLLAAVVAVLASHLFVRGLQEQRLATRSYYLSVALNLAEAGVEEAMWAANNGWVDAARGWADAGDGTGAKVRSVTTGLALAQGAGEIHLRLDSPGSSTPVVTALGRVLLPGQAPVLKQLRVALVRRNIWANAIVAKGTVTFNGSRVGIDAYDSALGPWHATTNRLDQATVATNSTSTGGLSVNNADIFGAVATGGAPPVVGPTGSVLGATSPPSLNNNIDPARVRADFAYNIPDASAPAGASTALGAINTALTLPRPGDTPGADGRYLYNATGINLNNTALTITGPVDLVVSGNVSIGGGSGSLVLTSGASTELALYAAGNLSISGNGAINATGSPPRMTFYGTRTAAEAATLGPQQFDLRGNAAYVGLVYAPNASIQLRGGGSTGRFDGAVIGASVTFNGNYDFHYDIRLGSLSSEDFFRPAGWIELTSPAGGGAPLARDARAPFAGKL